MSIAAWLNPTTCPAAPPPRAQMSEATRALHDALDAHAPWLHPTAHTVQLDLRSSAAVIEWQEAKAAALFAGEQAWSELPPLYARYGTAATAKLNGALRELYAATSALVVDGGMQAVALVADVLLERGDHAVVMRQVYNKSNAYIQRVAQRVGATVTIVDDGDHAELAAALKPSTRLVFAETYTNPRMRAQDIPALARAMTNAPRCQLVIDDTIATPWGWRVSPLALGAHIVVGSATKAVAGQDTGLGGYVVTNDGDLGNAMMDLLAMRGGILDDTRAQNVLDGLASAAAAHARRCASATRVAEFLANHPRVAEVFHPSRPDHVDAVVIARDYVRAGSIVTFRATGADENATQKLADVIAQSGVIRYALSFDGLATKVNHHRTVSEYFTPPDVLARSGLDRLIRIGIGIEDPEDLIACLNWALHQLS